MRIPTAIAQTSNIADEDLKPGPLSSIMHYLDIEVVKNLSRNPIFAAKFGQARWRVYQILNPQRMPAKGLDQAIGRPGRVTSVRRVSMFDPPPDSRKSKSAE